MKYNVKNCPAFVLMQNAKQTYFDVCGRGKIGTLCKDRSDCLIKRIIDKCKSHPCSIFATHLLKEFEIEETK